MPAFSISVSIQRLLAAVKKLEAALRAAGLPMFLARLPVCWLSWHYCRILDEKIARMDQVHSKFHTWLPVVRRMSLDGPARMELIDVDLSMRKDIELTKTTLWELRSYCLDVGRMFDQLGYKSARLQRRQAVFLKLLEDSCASACVMQDAVAAHDSAALALLRAQR